MEIENVIIKQLENGLLRLSPCEGYQLWDKKSHRKFPKADILHTEKVSTVHSPTA